jgi:hypothetical protein
VSKTENAVLRRWALNIEYFRHFTTGRDAPICEVELANEIERIEPLANIGQLAVAWWNARDELYRHEGAGDFAEIMAKRDDAAEAFQGALRDYIKAAPK